MIQEQQSMALSPYMELYDLIVPADNMLRKINELIDFSFVYEELKDNYLGFEEYRRKPVPEKVAKKMGIHYFLSLKYVQK